MNLASGVRNRYTCARLQPSGADRLQADTAALRSIAAIDLITRREQSVLGVANLAYSAS